MWARGTSADVRRAQKEPGPWNSMGIEVIEIIEIIEVLAVELSPRVVKGDYRSDRHWLRQAF